MAKNFMAAVRNQARTGGSGSNARQIPAQALLLSEIKREEPFLSLFAIRPATLAAIKDDIKANGYDQSKPVNVWRRSAEGGKWEYVLVDGFTRAKALEELRQLQVMAYVNDFTNEDEAMQYAIHNQRDRRNLTDAEIVRIVKAVDHREARGRKKAPNGAISQAPAGKSSAKTAEVIGTSRRKVEDARALAKHPELEKRVMAGDLKISAAVKKIKHDVRPQKESHARLLLEFTKAEAEEILTAISVKPSTIRRGIIDKIRKAKAAQQRG